MRHGVYVVLIILLSSVCVCVGRDRIIRFCHHWARFNFQQQPRLRPRDDAVPSLVACVRVYTPGVRGAFVRAYAYVRTRTCARTGTSSSFVLHHRLPPHVRVVVSHAVERLVGATVCSARSVAAIEAGLRDYQPTVGNPGGGDSEEALAVRAQLLATVLEGLQQEAHTALQFAGYFRRALGLL